MINVTISKMLEGCSSQLSLYIHVKFEAAVFDYFILKKKAFLRLFCAVTLHYIEGPVSL